MTSFVSALTHLCLPLHCPSDLLSTQLLLKTSSNSYLNYLLIHPLTMDQMNIFQKFLKQHLCPLIYDLFNLSFSLALKCQCSQISTIYTSNKKFHFMFLPFQHQLSVILSIVSCSFECIPLICYSKSSKFECLTSYEMYAGHNLYLCLSLFSIDMQ